MHEISYTRTAGERFGKDHRRETLEKKFAKDNQEFLFFFFFLIWLTRSNIVVTTSFTFVERSRQDIRSEVFIKIVALVKRPPYRLYLSLPISRLNNELTTM